MFTVLYIAKYSRPNTGEELIYKFTTSDDTLEKCDELASYHAEWILDEFPASGFILDSLERSEKVELEDMQFSEALIRVALEIERLRLMPELKDGIIYENLCDVQILLNMCARRSIDKNDFHIEKYEEDEL